MRTVQEMSNESLINNYLERLEVQSCKKGTLYNNKLYLTKLDYNKLKGKFQEIDVLYNSKFDQDNGLFIGIIGNFLGMISLQDKKPKFILHNINSIERISFNERNRKVRTVGKKMQ